MKALQAIFLDLDNTLWDVDPVILRAEQAMFAFLDERYPEVTRLHDLGAMQTIRLRIADEHPAMRHDFTFLRLAALRRHAELAGYPERMAEEAFDVFYRVRNEVELFPDVRPGLARLARRFRLFSVSNGNADLRAIGVHGYFEGAVAARDAGALKPDPQIFRRALHAAGLPPASVLHAGDDPEADIEGARRSGLHGAWINRRGLEWPVGVEPPALTVSSLIELAERLGS